jgi:protein CpxP
MKENNKYRMLWVVIGLLLALNVSILAWFTFFSQNIHPKRLFLETELKFDEKQAVSYKILRQEHAQQMRDLREEVKAMKTDFYKELSQPTISDDLLKEKALAIETKMAEADVLTFKHFQEVRKLCTPTQQTRFDEVIIDLIRSIERPEGPPPPRDGQEPMDGSPPPPPSER